MIETINLTKKFGRFTAVNKINLKLQPGEIYALLGPNGAGKTTTILMLLGISRPTSGEIRIFGQSIGELHFGGKQRIGVVAERQSFYPEMTALEYLLFFADMYAVASPDARLQELLERVHLWEWRHSLVGDYSAGMLRKLGVVRGLLHSPEIIILDEPVSNLDPYGIVEVREILLEERRRGRTILISSHILSEVEQTVDRVGIISRGNLIFEDTMANLRRKTAGQYKIEVELVDPKPAIVEGLRRLSFVSGVDKSAEKLIILTESDQDYRPAIGRFFAEQGAILLGMKQIEASLEEAFITITEAHVQDWVGEHGN